MAAMRSFTAFCAPRPRATTAMSADTPMTMPSIVRKERSLLARSAPSATLTVSPISIGSALPAAATTAAGRRPRRTGATRAGPTRAGAAAAPLAARRAAAERVHALPHLLVLVVALHLQRRGGEQRHALPLLDAADHLGEVEVADPQPDGARLVRAVLDRK